MRVAFDAYWWIEGPLSNQMVQREFITTWIRDHPSDEAILVVPDAHLQAARSSAPDSARVIGTRARPHALAAVTAVPRVARNARADVVINHNFTPLSGPAVTFIHDVLFQTNPEWFTWPERRYLSPIPVLARRATAVTTSSRQEARRIQALNHRLDRVVPVGITIGTDLASADPVRPPGLPAVQDFVLTVGRLNIRKNLRRTIDAALGSGCLSPSRPIVVVGETEGRAADLGPAADKARQDGTVVFLNRVDNAHLAWLYTNARIFLYLSLAEGYGLPPVEARHFGAPVLASDIPIFRETLSGYAEFVDPVDGTAISAGLQRMLARSVRRPPGSLRAVSDQWSACTARLGK